MPATARVLPSRDGGPVHDQLSLRGAHRVLLRDADRLRDLVEAGAAARDAAAVATDVRAWADTVHAHLTTEDDLLWPVLAASVGAHVDLSELRDDHAALEVLLGRVQEAAAAVAAGRDGGAVSGMAVELAELRDALREHVREEEAVVLPLLVLVPASARAALERRLRGSACDGS